MEIKKLFYVTNTVPPENDEPAWSLAVQDLGFEETTYLITGDTTRWERSLKDTGGRCKFLVEGAPSVMDIVDRAREEKASLIAANLNARGARLYRRSIMRNLIRSVHVPLLIIPKNTSKIQSLDKGILNHVIFATDWSPLSQHCMDAMVQLKRTIEELEIVTVISKKLSIRDMIKLKEMLDETRRTLLEQDIDAEAHIYAGKPSEEIMLAARDYNGTAIVMEASHRSVLKSFFYGNCAYEVAERAVVPILIIP